jgi:hypothetical protein
MQLLDTVLLCLAVLVLLSTEHFTTQGFTRCVNGRLDQGVQHPAELSIRLGWTESVHVCWNAHGVFTGSG